MYARILGCKREGKGLHIYIAKLWEISYTMPIFPPQTHLFFSFSWLEQKELYNFLLKQRAL